MSLQYGACVSSTPTVVPSTLKRTPATPPLSVAHAARTIDPETVAPATGDVSHTRGGVVSAGVAAPTTLTRDGGHGAPADARDALTMPASTAATRAHSAILPSTLRAIRTRVQLVMLLPIGRNVIGTEQTERHPGARVIRRNDSANVQKCGRDGAGAAPQPATELKGVGRKCKGGIPPWTTIPAHELIETRTSSFYRGTAGGSGYGSAAQAEIHSRRHGNRPRQRETRTRSQSADRRGIHQEDQEVHHRDLLHLAAGRLPAGVEDRADAEGGARRRRRRAQASCRTPKRSTTTCGCSRRRRRA